MDGSWRRGWGGCWCIDLLNMIGGEQALLPSAFASPPICIGFVNDLNDLSRREREIVGFLSAMSVNSSN